MGKKNPFVFTIGFDKSDPDHVYVTELLNTTEKKAKLIVMRQNVVDAISALRRA